MGAQSSRPTPETSSQSEAFQCSSKPPAHASEEARFQDSSNADAVSTGVAAARGIGTVDFEGIGVLHYIRGENCDILFTRPELQVPSIAGLLQKIREYLNSSKNGSGSEAFLQELLGLEGAQAALAAVLQGSTYITTLEKELPAIGDTPCSIGFPSGCSSLQQSNAELVKLASTTEANQLPFGGTFLVQVDETEERSQQQEQQQQQQQQQQQSSIADSLKKAAPAVSIKSTSAIHTSSAPHQLPTQSFAPQYSLNYSAPGPSQAQGPGLGTWPGSSSNHSSLQGSALQGTGSALRRGNSHLYGQLVPSAWSPSTGNTANTSNFTSSNFDFLLSNQKNSSSKRELPPDSASLELYGEHIQGHPLEYKHTPTAPRPSCPTHLKHSSRSGEGILDGPGSDSFGQIPRSKALQLPNSTMHRICPTSQWSGSFDRTMSLLKTLQSEPTHSLSKESRHPRRSSVCLQDVAVPEQASQTAASCTHLACQQNGSVSALEEVGTCKRDFGVAPAQQPLLDPSHHLNLKEADLNAPAGSGHWEEQPSMHVPFPLASTSQQDADFEGGATECEGYSRSGSGLPGCLQERESRVVMFEITIQPVPAEQDRHAVAFLKFEDITEQLQIQSALMSLAEGQLNLLSDLLPAHAIEFLACQQSDSISQNAGKLARSHQMVTLMFMDICGFTTVAKSVEPHEVMEWLNTLFSCLDGLTDQYKVHKVETAGDCYIVAAGVLSSESGDGFVRTLDKHDDPRASARCVMEFAKAVLQEAAKVKIPRTNSPVSVRIGLHSGDVVSGLIGSKLPKFSIFGDAMNTAARMESNGFPGRIHVSKTTKDLLPEYAWEPVGMIDVKGKGKMQTFLWDSNQVRS